MFTGMIEELGKIKTVVRNGKSAKVSVACKSIMDDVKLGDSIAVNGVCLTVVEFNKTGFVADASEETLMRSSLKNAVPGAVVNLERAMLMGGRFGGHIVQGHVDSTGKVLKVSKQGEFWTLTVTLPSEIRKYLAEKGSVCIDGISLTVAQDMGESFSIAVIPHTYENTNLHSLKPGDTVNLEVDVISRYAEKLLRNDAAESNLESLLNNMQ